MRSELEQERVGVRRRAFEILEVADQGDRLSRAFDVFILTLVALNILAIILEEGRDRPDGGDHGDSTASVVRAHGVLLRSLHCEAAWR